MKPASYTQLYIHLVFAIKFREYLLHKNIAPRVNEYMSGILTRMNHKSIIINGMPDHVHILFGLNPNITISATVHDIKRSSSLWINEEKLFRGKFAWQEGYGAFSYSRSQLDNVYNYIVTQEEHHKKQTFREEYIGFLKKYNIDFDQRFLFDFFDS